MKFNFEKQNNELNKDKKSSSNLHKGILTVATGLATLFPSSAQNFASINSDKTNKSEIENTSTKSNKNIETREEVKQECMKQINWFNNLINSKEYEQRFEDKINKNLNKKNKAILKQQKGEIKDILQELIIVIESNPSETIKKIDNKDEMLIGAYYVNGVMHVPDNNVETERYALNLAVKDLVQFDNNGLLDIENSFTKQELKVYREIQTHFKDSVTGKSPSLDDLKVMMINLKYDIQETLHIISNYGEYITDGQWEEVYKNKDKIKNSASLKLLNTIPASELVRFVELIP